MYRKTKSPMNIQFEITSYCNEKCRHCYNYWRSETDAAYYYNMPRDLFDRCMDEIISNNVLHVIFTGGEPLLDFDVLCHGIQRGTQAGLSVSCNSNLLVATETNLKRLKEAGLPHILTSLNSYDPVRNDEIVSHQGAFEKIVRGIRIAHDVGIKVSINMIIAKKNLHDIYETAALAYSLGVEKFHVTRVVPPSYIAKETLDEFKIETPELAVMLEHIDRIKKEVPITVKTLIPLPLCALQDLGKYSTLIGRPCAAGKRSMSIDARGNAHACWHMVQDFGNVAEVGLQQVWEKMEEWRSGKLVPAECQSCEYVGLCGAGCRLAGMAYYNNLAAPDNLRTGPSHITQPYTGTIGVDDVKVTMDTIIDFYRYQFAPDLYEKITNESYTVADGLRIRDEHGFSVINLFAGTSFFMEQKYVALLKRMCKSKKFMLSDFGPEYKDFFAYLITKKVIVPVVPHMALV